MSFGPNGPSAAWRIRIICNVSGLITGQTSENIGHFDLTGSLAASGRGSCPGRRRSGVNAGLEYRREALEHCIPGRHCSQAGDLASGQGLSEHFRCNGNFRVWEAFAETQIPSASSTRSSTNSRSAPAIVHSWYELSNGPRTTTPTPGRSRPSSRQSGTSASAVRTTARCVHRTWSCSQQLMIPSNRHQKMPCRRLDQAAKAIAGPVAWSRTHPVSRYGKPWKQHPATPQFRMLAQLGVSNTNRNGSLHHLQHHAPATWSHTWRCAHIELNMN